MRIVQLLSHAIESYDMLQMYARIGVEAFDIGPYIKPDEPHVDIRPPLDVPFYPELKDAVDALGTDDNLGAAQEHIPDALLDWLGDDGAIVIHHYTERLIGDWPRIRDWMQGHAGRRVIWRTVGQSVEYNEATMAPLRKDGLERVAYSPKEANIPGYIGHDALIRFGKDPADWYGWTGESEVVGNVTSEMEKRGIWCGYPFWEVATADLPRSPAGKGSEAHGGCGMLDYDAMRAYLRETRAYLYTGTQPASYTLGFIEAMMTGTPIVSIGPGHMRIFPYGPELFEAHEIAGVWSDDPQHAARLLRALLDDADVARELSESQRAKAIELFDLDTIAEQWRAYLS